MKKPKKVKSLVHLRRGVHAPMICCPFNRFNFEQYACGRSFPTKEALFSHLVLDHDWKPALWRLALYAAEYDVVEQGVAYISLLWKASWSPNGKRAATAPTIFAQIPNWDG